jgi:hypothetical protein
MIIDPLANIKKLSPLPTAVVNPMTGQVNNPSVQEKTQNDMTALASQQSPQPVGSTGNVPPITPIAQPTQQAQPVTQQPQPTAQPNNTQQNVVDLRPQAQQQPVTQQPAQNTAPTQSTTSPYSQQPILNRVANIEQGNQDDANIDHYQKQIDALNAERPQGLQAGDLAPLFTSSPYLNSDDLARQQKAEDTDMKMANFADLADSFANLIGTTKGAPNRQTMNLTGATARRYENMMAQRMALDKNYKDKVEKTLDLAMKMGAQNNEIINNQIGVAEKALTDVEQNKQNTIKNQQSQEQIDNTNKNNAANLAEKIRSDTANEKNTATANALHSANLKETERHNRVEEGLSAERSSKNGNSGNGTNSNKAVGINTSDGQVNVNKNWWNNTGWNLIEPYTKSTWINLRTKQILRNNKSGNGVSKQRAIQMANDAYNKQYDTPEKRKQGVIDNMGLSYQAQQALKSYASGKTFNPNAYSAAASRLSNLEVK